MNETLNLVKIAVSAASMNPSPSPAEQLTDVVPTTPSGGASPPGAIKLGQSPLGDRIVA